MIRHAWAEICDGPGYTNRLYWVIDDLGNEGAVQWEELPDEMCELFGISAALNRWALWYAAPSLAEMMIAVDTARTVWSEDGELHIAWMDRGQLRVLPLLDPPELLVAMQPTLENVRQIVLAVMPE